MTVPGGKAPLSPPLSPITWSQDVWELLVQHFYNREVNVPVQFVTFSVFKSIHLLMYLEYGSLCDSETRIHRDLSTLLIKHPDAAAENNFLASPDHFSPPYLPLSPPLL